MSFAEQRIQHIIEIIKSNTSFEVDAPKYSWVNNCASLHKPGTKRTYFFGTYLNSFSCLDYDEEPGKVYLWSERIASEHPILELHTVYKHNGTEEDVSVDMIVRHNHFKIDDKLIPLNEHDLNNKIFMRELAKSPTKIVGTPWISDTSVSTPIFKFRIRKNASDKSILNALKKAEIAYDEFIPIDHSTEEYDRSKWMRDTSEDHFKWVEDWKARHPNGK